MKRTQVRRANRLVGAADERRKDDRLVSTAGLPLMCVATKVHSFELAGWNNERRLMNAVEAASISGDLQTDITSLVLLGNVHMRELKQGQW